MSKLITAIDDLLNEKANAVALLEKIVTNINKEEVKNTHNNNINYADNFKSYEEIICGYNVVYGLAKVKAMTKEGKEYISIELVVYGIFQPLSGKRIPLGGKIHKEIEKAILSSH